MTIDDVFDGHDAVCFDTDDSNLICDIYEKQGAEEAWKKADELEAEYLGYLNKKFK